MGLTHTIVQWGSTSLGTVLSRHGAAPTTTSAVSRQRHLARLTPTTARMGSQTGRRDGLLPRRSGAAEFMGKAAQIRVADALPLPSPMTAMQALPTGWPVGRSRRKHGAAQTRARAVPQPPADAPELCFCLGCGHSMSLVL